MMSSFHDGRWRIQWVAEGVLNARVDVGVGELQMDWSVDRLRRRAVDPIISKANDV